jgi:tetratricopeptide (TPR) repeat protein
VYPLLISGAISLSIALSFILIPSKPSYVFGIICGLAAFVPAFILISRKIADRLRPLFERAQGQAKAGDMPNAIKTLEEARSWGRWQLLLGRQVNTEIGLLHYASGDEKKAVELLKQGYPKVATGHLALAAALYRSEGLEPAREALETGIRFNKRSAILYNVLAWMLHEKGKRDEAIKALGRALEADPGDEPTTDNLQRLQNEKKMNMRAFGDLWFMLKFETPKGMAAQAQPFRKGFRVPPKNPAKTRGRR